MTCPCCGIPVNDHVPLSADVRAAPPPRPTPPLDPLAAVLRSVECEVERLRAAAVGTAIPLADHMRDAIDEAEDADDSGEDIETKLTRLAALAVLWASRIRGAR